MFPGLIKYVLYAKEPALEDDIISPKYSLCEIITVPDFANVIGTLS